MTGAGFGLGSASSDDRRGRAEKSFGNLLRGRPCDPYAIKRTMPARWSMFLRAHFRSVAEVAVFFDVADRTAEYWWYGGTAPSGSAVALAAVAFPASFDAMMREAA